ncbi:hypothetical protein ACFXHA_16615 [Nocardia sp. NPDC059240]|uniref:hypothetical protein n=1 Tax=Nocardia sp. NPDC059240 TaxID=3346786 RepID=UPI0036A8DF15
MKRSLQQRLWAVSVVVVGIVVFGVIVIKAEFFSPHHNPWADAPAPSPDSVVASPDHGCGRFQPVGEAGTPDASVYSTGYLITVPQGSVTCGLARTVITNAYLRVQNFGTEFAAADGGWRCTVVNPYGGSSTLPVRPIDCHKDSDEVTLAEHLA